MTEAQVGIIGGGVIGSSIARELSKYRIKVFVWEKGGDVCSGASKANSGVIHSGINSPPGTLKAELCLEGNALFSSLAPQLEVPLENVGKLVIAKQEEDIKQLQLLKQRGEKNGVPGLRILDSDEVEKKERNVRCVVALWVPTASITSPYLYTISLAENAAINGVNFYLNTEVTDVKKENNNFIISTNQREFKVDVLINAAGINCREIVKMVEPPDFNIYPCRGQYLLLDKDYQYLVHSMIYPLPDSHLGVLGVHITPTVEGPLLLGPSAEYISDPHDIQTTQEIMASILKETCQILPAIPQNSIINSFSGIRCKLSCPNDERWKDFRIEESAQTPGMINLLGIESPGLTAAPAIAKKAVNLISHTITLRKNEDFKPCSHQYSKQVLGISTRDYEDLIKKDSNWGNVVCRCEQVSEAEVINALSNPLQTRTVSSVKYRCRAGMGRCQGGFCTQHIVRILRDKFGMDIIDIKQDSPESFLFAGHTRGTKNEKS